MRWICTGEDDALESWREMEVRDAAGEAAATLKLDGASHQTIRGFGGCFNEAGWAALERADAAAREGLLDELFGTSADDGCGFTLCRVPIGASDYAMRWYSHNEHDGDLAMEHFSIENDQRYLLPYLRAAQQRQPGLELFASPWSPPTWMKTHRAYNHGRLKPDAETLAGYALYFRRFVEAYRDAGFNVSQVHVQNEPGSDQKFPSCVMPAAQMRGFIRDHLGPEFERAGLDCEIWAGTFEKGAIHGWDFDETLMYAHQVHDVLRDAGARRHIAGVGFQWDGKAHVAQVHRAYPGLPILQTENECGDGRNTWPYAFYVFDLMCHYLNHGAVGYTYWNMVLPRGGESTWGWRQNSMACVEADGRVTRNPEFWVMKHLSHAVRPGAVRLGLSGDWCNFALAFRNPDGGEVVLVANPYPEALKVDVWGHTLELSRRSFSTVWR